MPHLPGTKIDVTPAQQEAFEQIATGSGMAHHPTTLAALERKGLIEQVGERVFGSGPLAVRIPVHEVPIPIHMAWCEWCAENVDDEDAK